jgi:hypothetical protein
MANLGVDDFKSKLIGGGARTNLFQVTPNFPGFAGGDVELTSFMCKGASLPGSVITAVPVPFRGRVLQVAGDRTFEPWMITIINDGKMICRSAFERWMNGINSHEANTGRSNPNDYMADMVVEQLDKEGTAVKRYDIKGCFPSDLAAIDLSYDNEGAIGEFQVTLTYQYWTSDTTS